MKRIVLMRHAKSSWKDPTLADQQRPLKGRGRRDSPRIARELRRRDWQPELVLSSHAARTRETWSLMAPGLDTTPVVLFLPDLYHGDAEDLCAVILSEAVEGVQTILALGHNPGWENAAFVLSGMNLEMKTASTALLKSEAQTWNKAMESKWQLVDLIHPRELPD